MPTANLNFPCPLHVIIRLDFPSIPHPANVPHTPLAATPTQSSGLNWTIVRPGGLSNDPAAQVRANRVPTQDV